MDSLGDELSTLSPSSGASGICVGVGAGVSVGFAVGVGVVVGAGVAVAD